MLVTRLSNEVSSSSTGTRCSSPGSVAATPSTSPSTSTANIASSVGASVATPLPAPGRLERRRARRGVPPEHREDTVQQDTLTIEATTGNLTIDNNKLKNLQYDTVPSLTLGGWYVLGVVVSDDDDAHNGHLSLKATTKQVIRDANPNGSFDTYHGAVSMSFVIVTGKFGGMLSFVVHSDVNAPDGELPSCPSCRHPPRASPSPPRPTSQPASSLTSTRLASTLEKKESSIDSFPDPSDALSGLQNLDDVNAEDSDSNREEEEEGRFLGPSIPYSELTVGVLKES